MACDNIKTPRKANMRDIPKVHLRPVKTGLISPSFDLNVIKYADGVEISGSELSIPKYDQGIQTNASDTSAASGTAEEAAATSAAATVAAEIAVANVKVDYVKVRLFPSQSVSSSSPTVVLFTTVDSDINGWYNPGTGRITPTKAGIYYISHDIELLLDSPTADWDSSIYINGIEWTHFNQAYKAAGTGSTVFELNGTTDYVDIRFRVFAPLPNSISGSGSGVRTRFEIYRIGDIP